MNNNNKKQKKKEIFINLLIMAIFIAATVILILLFPENRKDVLSNTGRYFMEMIIIFPAVLILMGLFSVWVPKEMILKHLGNASGFRGIILAFILGMLPTGPLYVAFPVAASLREKGASYSNIVIFLSAWACIKIPQELVEIQYLGFPFMALRLGLTVIFVTLMALLIQKFMTASKNKLNGDNNANI